MRLTARQVYEKLIGEDGICTLEGQIKFAFGEISIIVKQRDVVGNIMQEWLQGWFDKNQIEYAINKNSQMPPDFYLNPDDRTKNLLEVKAFNRNATPGFDIADFRMYQSEIIMKPYMLDVEYLIFGYDMSEDGIVTIKDVWLKKVWEITRRMKKWPINLQIKEGHVHKIRPGIWYVDENSQADYPTFESLEDFISAVEETVYRNEETRKEGPSWMARFQENYKEYKGCKLDVKRWYEIEDKYDLKKVKKLDRAQAELQKAMQDYEKQEKKVLAAEEKYKCALDKKGGFELQKAENVLKKSKERLDNYGKKLEEKKEQLRKMQL